MKVTSSTLQPCWINKRYMTVWFKDEDVYEYRQRHKYLVNIQRHWLGIKDSRSRLYRFWMWLWGWKLYRVSQTKQEYRNRFKRH